MVKYTYNCVQLVKEITQSFSFVTKYISFYMILTTGKNFNIFKITYAHVLDSC